MTRDDRPLTDARRRALVRSALGTLANRLCSARVAMIAADCAALDLDAPGIIDRASRWREACRAALDAGRRLPDSLDATA